MTGNISMNGKTALITGGTGGIGKATAEGLARLGAHVILVGRDQARGESAQQAIQSTTGSSRIDLLFADLSSQAAIHQLAAAVIERYPRLDVLVNNVGGLYGKRWETVDGIEATFAMNHVNVFLLTNLLLPLLKRSAPSRIVNVNSGGHRMGKLDFNNLQNERWSFGMAAYGSAKLANLLMTYEFARRLQGTGVTINAADPGGADTAMTQAMTPDLMPPAFRAMFPVLRFAQRRFLTVENAGRSSIYLASSPDVANVTGQYFSASAKPVNSSKASYDEDAAKRLWNLTEQLVRIPATSPSIVRA